MKQDQIDDKVFDLYDEYCHGHIDRRQFFERAAQLTVGAVSAVAMARALLPNYADAQEILFTDERIKANWINYPSPGGSSGEKDFLRLGVVRQQGLSHGHSRHTADGQLCGALEELAAVNMTVAVLVVQVKYLIVDLVLSHGARSSEELNIINPVLVFTSAARLA